ncbi:hypothetical protein BGZ98_010135 [Dissophora globulifera]|nr:hypothetical protein BGZ98_010135 [Dissophora globulifera]
MPLIHTRNEELSELFRPLFEDCPPEFEKAASIPFDRNTNSRGASLASKRPFGTPQPSNQAGSTMLLNLDHKFASSLFNTIANDFYGHTRNRDDYDIQSIRLLRNPVVWKRYHAEKQLRRQLAQDERTARKRHPPEMARNGSFMQGDDEDPELLFRDEILFHGTNQSSVPSILLNGLDPRMTVRANLGKGVYFSDAIEKCMQYVDKQTTMEQEYAIVLCCVQLGRVLVEPFEKAKHALGQHTMFLPEGYDSAVAQDVFKEWIVFEKSQILPLCVINFKASNKSDSFFRLSTHQVLFHKINRYPSTIHDIQRVCTVPTPTDLNQEAVSILESQEWRPPPSNIASMLSIVFRLPRDRAQVRNIHFPHGKEWAFHTIGDAGESRYAVSSDAALTSLLQLTRNIETMQERMAADKNASFVARNTERVAIENLLASLPNGDMLVSMLPALKPRLQETLAVLVHTKESLSRLSVQAAAPSLLSSLDTQRMYLDQLDALSVLDPEMTGLLKTWSPHQIVTGAGVIMMRETLAQNVRQDSERDERQLAALQAEQARTMRQGQAYVTAITLQELEMRSENAQRLRGVRGVQEDFQMRNVEVYTIETKSWPLLVAELLMPEVMLTQLDNWDQTVNWTNSCQHPSNDPISQDTKNQELAWWDMCPNRVFKAPPASHLFWPVDPRRRIPNRRVFLFTDYLEWMFTEKENRIRKRSWREKQATPQGQCTPPDDLLQDLDMASFIQEQLDQLDPTILTAVRGLSSRQGTVVFNRKERQKELDRMGADLLDELFVDAEPHMLLQDGANTGGNSLGSQAATAECPICQDLLELPDLGGTIPATRPVPEKVVKLKSCRHCFHEDCIQEWFKSEGSQLKCPMCNTMCMTEAKTGATKNAMRGQRPQKLGPMPDGVMGYCFDARLACYFIYIVMPAHKIPDPNGSSTSQINATISVSADVRHAIIPFSARLGPLLMMRLITVFYYGHLFRVGHSLTRGTNNVVVWNGVHLRTSMSGQYGYPAPNFESNCWQEINQKGVAMGLDQLVLSIPEADGSLAADITADPQVAGAGINLPADVLADLAVQELSSIPKEYGYTAVFSVGTYDDLLTPDSEDKNHLQERSNGASGNGSRLFNLLVDTGSDLVVVTSATCTDPECALLRHRYDSTASSTSHPTRNLATGEFRWAQLYGDGSIANGTLVQDTLGFVSTTDADTNSSTTTTAMTTIKLLNQTILVVDQPGLHLTRSYGQGIDGIIGLNLQSSIIASTVIQNLQRIEDAPVETPSSSSRSSSFTPSLSATSDLTMPGMGCMSLWLGHSLAPGQGGELLLNAVDPSRFQGPIHWIDRGPSPCDWSIPLDRGIMVRRPEFSSWSSLPSSSSSSQSFANLTALLETEQTFAVLDSGSDGIYLQKKIYDSLFQQVPGAQQLQTGFWRVPCIGTTELVFGIQGKNYKLAYEDWVKKPSNETRSTSSSSSSLLRPGPKTLLAGGGVLSSGMCQSKVYGSSPGPTLLGSAFLRSVYTVFDFSRPGPYQSYFPQVAPTIQQGKHHPHLTSLRQQQLHQKHTSGSLNPYKSIAIRREGKNRWERRAALTPEAVEKLIKETGIKVYVQPSTKRIFSDDKYRAAGAIVQEDLTPADVILGIKEVPVKDLIPGKTYVYFSHTHKGQTYNMPMLQDVLDKNIRLIDYELMANEQKQRLVLFGKHAGYAGMIDGVHGLGQRLLGLGYSSPFLHVGMAHNYKTLASANLSLQMLGNTIQDEGTPKEFGPMTFVFTGGGNVSKGAQAVFKSLPHEFVDPKDLKKIATSKNMRLDRIYAAEVNIADHIRHKSKNLFTTDQEYYANPDQFTSVFHKDIAPYTSMIINGAYWDTRYPRLMTTEQLKTIQSDPANKFRMLSVADISCDINGSFEFMSHATSIEDPFFYVDAVGQREHKDTEAPGVQIMSVDILPSELPLESSQHFSDSLYPFVKELIRDNNEHPVLSGATIAEGGALKPAHHGLSKILKDTNAKENLAKIKAAALQGGASSSTKSTSFGTSTKPKKVLLCGSGFVAGPLVDYLLRDPQISITIASNSLAEATALALNKPNTTVVPLDVKDDAKMASLVKNSDIVVSFVPAPFHPIIAEHCIQERKNMVTASYISPAMKSLDERAQRAGITIMNEIGLDPGIDHLSAMRMIDEVKAEGGKVTSFVSWCGGLPAPEASDVPLSYKFSWSPRGVLTAGLNDAKFRMHNGFHEIPGKDLMKKHFPDVPIFPGFSLEGVANRDSLSYAETYGLGPVENLDTMFRGTLRYKGYADLMYSFNRLGLLNADNSHQNFNTWPEFMDNILFGGQGSSHDNSSRQAAIADRLDLPKNHATVGKVVDALQWLSLIPGSSSAGDISAFTAKNSTTTLDSFCSLLMTKLKYNPLERDMVVLHHEFGVALKDGSEQTRTSTLVSYGAFETYTAMAKTVGLPAAMATEMLLKGEITEKGVLAPTMPRVYNTILEKLDGEGVRVKEQIVHKPMRPMLNWSGSGVFK